MTNENQYQQVKSEYRRTLLDSEQKSIESFDKTVLALSSGALGLTMTFFRNIVGPTQTGQMTYPLVAWSCWALSLICTLSSFWLSAGAMRKAIQQLDEGTIGQESLGGWRDKATGLTTFGGGLAFIIGVIAMIVFVAGN